MEKRKYKRRHLIYYLRVFSQSTDQLIGHMADLTPEGLMMVSESALSPNQDYAFYMSLPVEIHAKKRLEFTAHCLWAKKDVNPNFYAMGFRFIEIAQVDKDTIFELIEAFGFND